MEQSKRDYICGVLFSRSVRSSFASLSLVPKALPSPDETRTTHSESDRPRNDECPILVRLQFFENVTELRSFCRKIYKLGDMLRIQISNENSRWREVGSQCETEWGKARLVVDLASVDQAERNIEIVAAKYWDMTRCQMWQKRCLPKKDGQRQKRSEENMPTTTNLGAAEGLRSGDSNDEKHGHGGGVGKRLQGEMVANFLLNAMINKLISQESRNSEGFHASSNWTTLSSEVSVEATSRARNILNAGSGVLDAAGGSGHVSMALGCLGIQSTVVDPRPGCGKLPGRDRKVWNRALRSKSSTLPDRNDERHAQVVICQPVVPYRSFRGWFGSPPTGIDTSFRHPDKAALPVCDESGELLANCSAIIALHPDECTGSIVDIAVKNRIPFAIVPCCVFCRLFPNRKIPGSGNVVSSYEDLLDYLMSKHESIRRTQLPFQGKNIVLWSTF